MIGDSLELQLCFFRWLNEDCLGWVIRFLDLLTQRRRQTADASSSASSSSAVQAPPPNAPVTNAGKKITTNQGQTPYPIEEAVKVEVPKPETSIPNSTPAESGK